jgi:UDP-N-acetylmuramate dehydrogenase
MQIKKNYNLSKLNTFGLDVNADYFIEIKSEIELKELFKLPEFKKNKKIFLGGGSNIIFTKDFDGIAVLNKLKGIKITKNGETNVEVRAMGGEIWNDLIGFAVNHGYWGIENLSLVPGTVGAAPIQNIGAYGTEIKDTLLNVEAFEIENGQKKIFTKEECELGYRDSIFKNKLKGKYFITAITLKLSKIPKPNISYKMLREYLEKSTDTKVLAGKNKITEHSLKNISEAVTSIRQSKLPDPKILGNAGSFFKNVFVTKQQLQNLQEKFPNIPYFNEETDLTPDPSPYKGEGGNIKIPAGWLIEQTGWKGKKIGNVGVHEKQALVLVNYGGATGQEILDLANKIIASVKEKFGLELTPEVNLI